MFEKEYKKVCLVEQNKNIVDRSGISRLLRIKKIIFFSCNI